MRTHYNLNWRQLTHDGWADELNKKDYDVTGTLKFNNGRRVSKTAANKQLIAYWNKLDRIFFGKSVKKGVGIDRWVFVEYGTCGNNLHYHFKARAPAEPVFFCAVANIIWSGMNPQTAALKFNEITPTIDSQRSAFYVTKGTKNFYYDAAGLVASHKNPNDTDIESYQTLAQAKRILYHTSHKNIEQAQQITAQHIVNAENRYQQRNKRAEALAAR